LEQPEDLLQIGTSKWIIASGMGDRGASFCWIPTPSRRGAFTPACRSKYIVSINPGSLNDQLVNAPTFNLDFSSSYKFNENLTFSLEAVNLSNQGQNQYRDSIGQRPYVLHYTGREFFAGVRYTY
jgi:outer membrane receptor protein involved in Fe transport